MSRLAALRARLRLLFSRRATEARMNQEFRFHLEMEAAKHVQAGMSPEAARRRAALDFGATQEHREEMRVGRGLAWLGGWSLDVKLGLRMLVKSPGLAIVGGLGMALATAIGAGAHAVVNSYFWPALPLDEGDRVVAIINWDPRLSDNDKRVGYELTTWRRELRSVVDVGAFRTVGRNLIAASGQSEPIVMAEMTASGFRTARVPPLLGRPLLDADENPGAAPVVVIGHDVWQQRFGGDAAILGRPLRLGRVVHTIVGVMPPGFAFPISHRYWIPLRLDPAPRVSGEGPELDVFGRLAPGVTPGVAVAELAVIAQRLAALGPADRARLEPRIVPYTDIFTQAEGESWEVVMMQLVISLLLVVVCLNVAVLVYARTVTRTTEIAVRTALGASRRRIVTQLFAEAFVLSVLSAMVGLGLVGLGLRYFDRVIGLTSETGKAPFWIDPGLSLGTVLYTLGLAVLGAVIVGVLPALRATGGRLHAAMAAAGVKARLGPTWTFLIVAQVAIAVAVLPPALMKGKELLESAATEPGFPTREFLWARFSPEARGARSDGVITTLTGESGDSVRAKQTELLARLDGEPNVIGTTLAAAVPGNERNDWVEVDEPGPGVDVRVGEVAESYFRVFDVEVLSGRGFGPGDAALATDRPVVVNRSFVLDVLRGGEAVGHRLRYRATGDSTTPWLSIVGVVEDFPSHVGRFGETNAAVYQLVAPGEMQTGLVMVRLRGQSPSGFIPTLQRITASVDPTLQLFRIQPMNATYAELGRLMGLLALAVGAITSSVLLLSAGGIHALMSFTINQRRREIGIRSALGADARRLLSGVLARAIRQLALGVGVGLLLALAVDRLSGGAAMGPRRWVLLPAMAALMIGVGLLAAAGPARRGLRVEPTEALRSD